jgi:hypothetical protein
LVARHGKRLVEISDVGVGVGEVAAPHNRQNVTVLAAIATEESSKFTVFRRFKNESVKSDTVKLAVVSRAKFHPPSRRPSVQSGGHCLLNLPSGVQSLVNMRASIIKPQAQKAALTLTS